MRNTLSALCPFLTGAQLDQFELYHAMLADWNTRVNLTAITSPKDVAEKHFADSLAALPLLPEAAEVIDVGTGAGFPGVPLLIVRPDLQLTLLDGLNKRITFLNALLERLGLSAETVHMRAEDAGQSPLYRERFDIALTRAVAPLAVLTELTVPLLKIGGQSIAYKGAAEEELTASATAQHLLHAKASVTEVNAAYGRRTLIVLTKTAATPKLYPRKVGTPEKKPLA